MRTVRLHRHQLLRLTVDGWQRVLAREWDDEARACLTHWAEHDLPLVVTRQPAGLPDRVIAAGLAAPARWSRRRMALQAPWSDVRSFDEFPRLAEVTAQMPGAGRTAWRALGAELDCAGIDARVYGSHGWQWLSGLNYVHRDSDVDLCLTAIDATRADLAVAALCRFEAPDRPRLDGEFLFRDGMACAWREWQAWREGRCTRVLLKSLEGPSLQCGTTAFDRAFDVATW